MQAGLVGQPRLEIELSQNSHFCDTSNDLSVIQQFKIIAD